MPTQLGIACRRDLQPRCERALEEAGALSVTLAGRTLDAADERRS